MNNRIPLIMEGVVKHGPIIKNDIENKKHGKSTLPTMHLTQFIETNKKLEHKFTTIPEYDLALI